MSKSKSTQTKTKTTPKPDMASAPNESKTSKKQLMLDMLSRPEGATIAELEKATGWQQHSVRGALVNLKNKEKKAITNSKDEEGPRRYFLKNQEAV
jgi:hypothetical protein